MTERAPILVIQARTKEKSIAAEREIIDNIAQRAKVETTYVNPFTDNPRHWRSHSFLAEDHSAVILLGTAETLHTRSTHHLQKKFDDLALPVIQRAMEGDPPVLGICYGHKAMVRAGGGRVALDPDRAEAGTGELALTSLGEEHFIFRGTTSPLPMSFCHLESAIELPEGAQVLGKTARDPHSVWVINDNKIGMQGHPQIKKTDSLIQAIEKSKDSKFGAYVQTYPFIETPNAEKILVNFMIAV